MMADTKKTMSGPQVIARMTALEGFVRLLIRREISEDGPEAVDAFLNELSRAAKAQGRSLGHKETAVENDIHTDDFLESIREELKGATNGK